MHIWDDHDNIIQLKDELDKYTRSFSLNSAA